MSEWTNSRDLLPPFGVPILLKGKKGKIRIGQLMIIINTNPEECLGETPQEMKDAAFLWMNLPEPPK